MSGYSVDLDELAAAIARMSACQQSLVDLAANVSDQTGRLHDEWSGLAKDAHAAAYSSWRGDFADMSSALARMREVADTARGNYTRAVDANVAMWEQLG